MNALLWAFAIMPAGQLPPAPPPPVIDPPRPLQRRLLAWLPGQARCGGEPVAATAMRRPYLALAWLGADRPEPVTVRFRLDASGRPLSIARDGTRAALFGDDIGPSLAASRFAAGAEKGGCAITYTARLTDYADTPVADLISYTLNSLQGQLPREGWAAIFPAAATCNDAPRPAPLVQTYPAFDALPGTPGSRDWTMLAYDLDAKGAPVRIAVLTGTGNRALDAAGQAALARSRYTHGPRTGCRYPFWKAPAVLPAPHAPEEDAIRPAGATCPAKLPNVRPPTLAMPEPYRRRSIEGWAMIAYDVAPWGAIGNARVLAAEPAAEFGDWALNVVRSISKAPSTTGYVGCVDRVRFRIGDDAKLIVDKATVPEALPPVD